MFFKKKPKPAPQYPPHYVHELDNLVNGGLARKVTPEHMAEQLIRNGHAAVMVGGLAATKAGHELIFKGLMK